MLSHQGRNVPLLRERQKAHYGVSRSELVPRRHGCEHAPSSWLIPFPATGLPRILPDPAPDLRNEAPRYEVWSLRRIAAARSVGFESTIRMRKSNVC
jgi:hypothetical protein